MKLKITIGLFLATFLLSAQSSARMNRDIEVAEKILETLLEENDEPIYAYDNVFVIGGNSKVEGTYLEGFGAMFSITPRNLLKSSKKMGLGKKKHKSSSRVTIVRPGQSKIHYDMDEMEIDEEALKKKFKAVVETFICDYGYLMRQLGDQEKIVIRYGTNPSNIFNWESSFPVLADFGLSTLNDTRFGGYNYSATITKKAINDFQSERISDDQLKSQIEFVFEAAEDRAEKYKDLDLLSSVIGKVHKNDFDNAGLYLSGASNYEKIDGLGAIFKWNIRQTGKAYFSFPRSSKAKIKWSDNGFLFLDEAEEEKKAREARDKEAQKELDLDQAYGEFIDALRQSIIEYGSIVKSLKGNEALIFKLKFPKCDDCKKMPEHLEITAKKATLDAYRKDQVTLEKAVGQLLIK